MGHDHTHSHGTAAAAHRGRLAIVLGILLFVLATARWSPAQEPPGGGSLVLEAGGDWVGPGHNAVIMVGDKAYNIYHAYQATNGASRLRIAELAKRKAWAKDAHVRAHVLVAAYSIAFLDRVPTFAAVSEAVAGARA